MTVRCHLVPPHRDPPPIIQHQVESHCVLLRVVDRPLEHVGGNDTGLAGVTTSKSLRHTVRISIGATEAQALHVSSGEDGEFENRLQCLKGFRKANVYTSLVVRVLPRNCSQSHPI